MRRNRILCLAQEDEMFATDQVEKGIGFVVFLHVDLRSDGLIDAAACYWI